MICSFVESGIPRTASPPFQSTDYVRHSLFIVGEGHTFSGYVLPPVRPVKLVSLVARVSSFPRRCSLFDHASILSFLSCRQGFSGPRQRDICFPPFDRFSSALDDSWKPAHPSFSLLASRPASARQYRPFFPFGMNALLPFQGERPFSPGLSDDLLPFGGLRFAR